MVVRRKMDKITVVYASSAIIAAAVHCMSL